MAVINLRNVVTLGVLDDGIYPSVYDGQTGEYIGTVDGEGKGVKTVPTVYMYYRNNGHLYLYRTKEKIEIDLTNVTAYDNSALFKLTEKDDVSNADIIEFESRNIDVNHYEYKTNWVKSTQQYLYILVPIIRSISTILVQGVISNQIFGLIGIYVHQGKSWWMYRTNVKSTLDFNDAVNEILDVQVYVRELTADDLNPVEQLTRMLTEHINNKFNPHEVTKEQVGLGNVNNTADKDKPVSGPQKEYIDALEKRVKIWFRQLQIWINSHVKELNERFQDVWNALNKKLDKEDYENDKDGFYNHIRNFNNPHKVTADQVGLGNVSNDINSIKIDLQSLEVNLTNKQDKVSDELNTDNKRIVDAINEIYDLAVEHNNHVLSNSIKRIEVVSEIPTEFNNGTLYIRIPRNEEDYITVTINTEPKDSTITLINSEDHTVTGTGSASIECLIQSRLHYIVEKDNYVTKDVYVELGVEDTTIQVVLTPKTLKTLNITSVPDNATIELRKSENDELLASGVGTCSYFTYNPITIKVKVGGLDEYFEYEETLVLDKNIDREIELTKKPIEYGYVILTAIDSNSQSKISATVYDKLTDSILGQITKDTPLQLTGKVKSSQILRIVSSGYDDQEVTITYTNPATNVTIEMVETPPETGTIRCQAVTTENSPIESATFEYHTGDQSWKSIGTTENGYSEYVTAAVGSTVYFRVSAGGYITNTVYGNINNTELKEVQCRLEAVPVVIDVTLTVKVYDNYLNEHQYIEANIYDDESCQNLVGTSTPDVPFTITKEQNTSINIWIKAVNSEKYNIATSTLNFDYDKIVEIECVRILNGVIRIVTVDSTTNDRISANVYENSELIGTTPATNEEDPLVINTTIGKQITLKFEADGYDTKDNVILEGYDPINSKIESVSLNKTTISVSNNIKVVNENEEPITDGLAKLQYKTSDSDVWSEAIINKEIVTTVEDTVGSEYNYRIVNVSNSETIYSSGVFIIKEPTGSDIVITWDRSFENDGIGYMQIEGAGLEHPVFRVK